MLCIVVQLTRLFRYLCSSPTRRSSDLDGAARDFGARPREDEADGRGLPRREGHRGRDHGPGVLQRLAAPGDEGRRAHRDRKSTRLNSSHVKIAYAVFCLKKKNRKEQRE